MFHVYYQNYLFILLIHSIIVRFTNFVCQNEIFKLSTTFRLIINRDIIFRFFFIYPFHYTHLIY